MIKIGILTTSRLSQFRLNTLEPILNDKNFAIKVAIIDDRPGKTLKQKFIKNLKRRRGGYMIIMAIKSMFAKNIYSIDTKEFCKINEIHVLETRKPYSKLTIESINKFDLDLLVLVGGFGIIRSSLLEVTPIGVLSYHHGDMRKYRGMPPVFWELYNNVTVQILSAGLDSGTPIEEKLIEIKKNDTLKVLHKRVMKESENMLYNALKKVTKESFIPKKINNYGKVYTLPNLRQWIMLNLKVFFRKLK